MRRILLAILTVGTLCSTPAFAEIINGENTANWQLVLKDSYNWAFFFNYKKTDGTCTFYTGILARENFNLVVQRSWAYLMYDSEKDIWVMTYNALYDTRIFTTFIRKWDNANYTAYEGVAHHQNGFITLTSGIRGKIIRGSLGSHQASSPSSLAREADANGIITSALSLSQMSYRPGQRIAFSATLTEEDANLGAADGYLIGISPKGDFYSVNPHGELVEGFTPLITSWGMREIRDVAIGSTVIPADLPAGTWQWFLKCVQPGSDVTLKSNGLVTLAAACNVAGTPVDENASIIGALVPQSGSLSDLGASITAAVQLAEKDVNAYLAEAGLPQHVILVVKDSAGEATTAIAATEELLAEDLPTVIIGPATSEATLFSASKASDGGVCMISPTATSPDLSRPNDNIMRMVMDDTQQAAATVQLLKRDGIDHVLFLVCIDSYTTPLMIGIQDAFTESDGYVSGIFGYSARDESDDLINDYISQMASLATNTEADKIAVVFLTVGDATGVFTEAAKYASLTAIRWYTSDSLAQSAAILSDSALASFAATVRLTAPLPNFEATTLSRHVDAALTEQGLTPRSYATLYYDAFVLAALSQTILGDTPTIAGDMTNLRLAAEYYSLAASGLISFDANDDRAEGSYAYWQVTTDAEGAISWVKTDIWNSRTQLFE